MDASGGKPESLCRVCGDKASGKHYGVPSCDGCRGFFKRSIRRNLDYVCKENGHCVVDVTRRNQCQACRFSKCLRVNMKKDAVQHERAPRPASTSAYHQLAIQKLGYNFTRQQTFFPSHAPLTFTGFPHLAYNGLQHTPDAFSNVHGSFLENHSFQDFSASRMPDAIPADISQLNPLLGSQINSLTSLSPFKIPLFSSPLDYPVAHPGYFPSNIFYPPVMPTDNLGTIEARTSKPTDNGPSQSKFTSPIENTDKPDSQLQDKIKEDEVTSSEEAFKIECFTDDVSKDDSRNQLLHSPSSFEPPIHVLPRNMDKHSFQMSSLRNLTQQTDYSTRDRQKIVRLAESLKASEENIQKEEKMWKLTHDYFCHTSEDVSDPAAKMLMLSIKWLHGVLPFVKMKNTEQTCLLHNNWKELFILTAAQHSFRLEDVMTHVHYKRPNIKEQLNKITALLKRILQYNLDKSEYEWLKSALLFRTDSMDTFALPQIEILQEQTLLLLQKHCSVKDSCRLGRLMLLLPSICSVASQGLLEDILFPSTSVEDINTTLSRIFMYTSP